MTVAAAKDGMVAADGRLTPSGETVTKVVRMPDGGVAAAAGLWSAAYAALSWLADGGSLDGRGDRMPPDVEDCVVLIARPDGSHWLLEGRFPAYPLLDREASIGCGREGARALMAAGYSAVEAVAMVANLDPACGAPLQMMRVEPTHEYSAAVPYTVTQKPAPAKAKRKPTKSPARRRG